MLYLFLKSFHLVAVLVWVGGVLALAVLLGSLGKTSLPRAPHEHGLLAVLYKWDLWVTTPALGLVWILGITLAVMSGWYNAPWLWLKVAIVFLLSGMHGSQSAMLRRIVSGAAQRRAWVRSTTGAVLVAITAVVLLVIIKPWGSV